MQLLILRNKNAIKWPYLEGWSFVVAGLFKVLYITSSFRYRWYPFIAECVEDFGIFIITSAAVFSKSDVKFFATVFSRCLFVCVLISFASSYTWEMFDYKAAPCLLHF